MQKLKNNVYSLPTLTHLTILEFQLDRQTKNVLKSPLKTHQCHTNHIVHDLFNIYSNHTMFKLQRTRIQNTQFAVIISDTPVTLKQSQGHQTYNDNVDPNQGYYEKFERSCFTGV